MTDADIESLVGDATEKLKTIKVELLEKPDGLTRHKFQKKVSSKIIHGLKYFDRGQIISRGRIRLVTGYSDDDTNENVQTFMYHF